MSSTIALLTNLQTLSLLYVIMYFTQNLSGKRQFYGVSLNSNYFNKDEFRYLDKKFKKLITIGFIVSLFITLVLIYIFKAYNISLVLPVLGYLLYQFIVYVNIHNEVKLVKQELALNISDLDLPKTKVIFDTDFMNKKNKIIKKYSILLIIPIIFIALLGIYILYNYSSIPDIIPTHWGISGEADAFANKTFMAVLSQVLMSLGLGVIIYISAISSLKSRSKLSIDEFEESKKACLYYLNKLGAAFVILNLAMSTLFVDILLALYKGSSVHPIVLWPATVILIISAIYQIYLFYTSHSKIKSSLYSVDDEDDMWILGCIYNNPNDPSLFVEKRFGIGWTINVGTTLGKIFLISPFILIIIALIFI